LETFSPESLKKRVEYEPKKSCPSNRKRKKNRKVPKTKKKQNSLFMEKTAKVTRGKKKIP